MDAIDDVLVCSFVGGNQTEVIGIWKSDEASAVEVVTGVDVVLEILDDGVEGKEERDGTEWITLKNTSLYHVGIRVKDSTLL